LNRRIRNRTYGGVRGRELIAPSYSITFKIKIEYFEYLYFLHKERGETTENESFQHCYFIKKLIL
jgi:hypothetical protein